MHKRGVLHDGLPTILIVVAVALVIGMHLGLAGAIIADSKWTGLATDAVLAIVVLKAAFIALAHFGISRRRGAKTPTNAEPNPQGDRLRGSGCHGGGSADTQRRRLSG